MKTWARGPGWALAVLALAALPLAAQVSTGSIYGTVKDESTYADPHRYPTGIPYVLVNGAVVVDDSRMRPQGTGRILTRPR